MEKDSVNDCKFLLMGGSAGSIEALMRMLPMLQLSKTFAIIVVLHRKNTEDTTLEELIAKKTVMAQKEVEDKTQLLAGSIYVAPSDYHLLFEKNGTLSLDVSEKVNYSRPSIDVAFESAAEAFGRNVAAVLLSGANEDGTAGLMAVKKHGGLVIVQDPRSAEMPFMPQNAIDHVQVDYVLTPEDIAVLVNTIDQ